MAGGGNLTDLPNWPARLPLAHRRQVGATLADVRVAIPDGDFVIQPEGEEVLLDAAYTAAPAGDGNQPGKMLKLTGLKHLFRSPTAAQHKRYNAQASRSVVVGGSRAGRTVYPTTHAVLADLYDELIVSVEGYALDGVALTSDVNARGSMDLLHKVTAAQELFAPASTVTTDSTETDPE